MTDTKAPQTSDSRIEKARTPLFDEYCSHLHWKCGGSRNPTFYEAWEAVLDVLDKKRKPTPDEYFLNMLKAEKARYEQHGGTLTIWDAWNIAIDTLWKYGMVKTEQLPLFESPPPAPPSASQTSLSL